MEELTLGGLYADGKYLGTGMIQAREMVRIYSLKGPITWGPKKSEGNDDDSLSESMLLHGA